MKMKTLWICLSLLMGISIHALIITDDGRMVYSEISPTKTFTLINDTAAMVTMDITVTPDLLVLPTSSITVLPYRIQLLFVRANVPEEATPNSRYEGSVLFQGNSLFSRKKVIITKAKDTSF